MRLIKLKDKQLYLVGALFLLALSARVYQLNVPFVEPYNSLTRQAMSASIARNFYQDGFKFFYPALDENGSDPALFCGEMQITTYLMAIFYKVLGGVHEWSARLVSVIFSIGTCFLVFWWVRRYYGSAAAFASGLFLSLSPLNLALSRSVQPESAMLFASAGAILCYDRYLDTHRIRYWITSAILTFMAIAVKIQAAYIYMVLFFLMWSRDKSFYLRSKNLLFYALSGSAFLWYFYMWHISKGLVLAYNPYDYTVNRGPSSLNYWQVLLNTQMLVTVLKYLFFHILTPLGMVLCVWAVKQLISTSRTKTPLLIAWGASILIYYLVFYRFIIEHSYYQMPVIVLAAILFGVGARDLWEKYKTSKLVFFGVIALGLVSILNVGYYARGIYFIPKEHMDIVRAGQFVDATADANDLVVASYGGSSVLNYYTHRKGWPLDVRSQTADRLIADLERYKTKGAKYYVTSRLDQLKDNKLFYAYLMKTYKVLIQNNSFIVFSLKSS